MRFLKLMLVFIGMTSLSTPAKEIRVGTTNGQVVTIVEALRQAEPGDEIILSPGVYREAGIRWTRGGTADSPIVLRSDGNGPVVICGSVLVTDWVDIGNGIWKRADWKHDSQQLFVTGQPLQQIAARNPFTQQDAGDGNKCLLPQGRSVQDLVPNSFFYDVDTQTLFCRLVGSQNPNQLLVEASISNDVMDGNGQSHIVLKGLIFRHSNGTSTGQRSALLRVNGNHWRIEDCTFEQGDFSGIALAGEGHQIRQCRIQDNGCVGIDVNGGESDDRPPQQILLENLIVRNNNHRNFYSYWHAGGIKLIPNVRGVTIRGCDIRDNYGPGVWFDASGGNNRIEDNLVVRNTVGISIEISRPSPGDTYTALIQNNRIAFNRHQGIYVSASSQVRVIRNTLFQNRWDMVLHGMPRQEGSLSGNEVKDNLLLGNNADLIVYAGPEAHANQINGNIYARGQGKAKIGVVDHPGYDVSFSDLRALQKAYPDFEKQGQSLSVRFRDPDRLDFRVIGDSMVRGKGWVQSSVSGTGSQHP
jgi:parallel beta-helix repeat protein